VSSWGQRSPSGDRALGHARTGLRTASGVFEDAALDALGASQKRDALLLELLPATKDH